MGLFKNITRTNALPADHQRQTRQTGTTHIHNPGPSPLLPLIFAVAAVCGTAIAGLLSWKAGVFLMTKWIEKKRINQVLFYNVLKKVKCRTLLRKRVLSG